VTLSLSFYIYFLFFYIFTPNAAKIGTVTDKGMRMCVDPEGNWVTMNEWAEGEPGRLAENKINSQLPTVEAARRSQGFQKIRNIKTSLCTEYVSLYMSTYCKLDNCNRERCLI
jgi:hypothetical protein